MKHCFVSLFHLNMANEKGLKYPFPCARKSNKNVLNTKKWRDETNSARLFSFHSFCYFSTEAYVLCYCYCIMGEIFYSFKRAKS